MFAKHNLQCSLHFNNIYCVCCLGRCRKKLDELERLLEIAKKNYVQLGGKLAEDRRRLKEG